MELSRPAGDAEHPAAVSARLSGTLATMGPVAVDATGTKIAFAVLSDTSRDGVVSPVDDDAAVFVSDPAKGSLAIERTEPPLLADELRPKIVAALSIPADKVQIVHAGRKLEVTAELPLKEGEKAAALVDRWNAAGRGLAAAVPMKQALLKVRVGPFSATVLPPEGTEGAAQGLVRALGRLFQDPGALPLVQHHPTLTTLSGGSFPRTLSGIFENKGAAPIGPIEIVVTTRPSPGDPVDKPDPNRRQVKASVGPIEPGRKLAYRVTIWEVEHGPDFDTVYSVGGKEIALLNQYAREDGLDLLDTALDMHREHAAAIENDASPGSRWSVIRVKLSESHVALEEAARSAMMARVFGAVARHFRAYHQGVALRIWFLAPGGGGWALDEGGKPARFDREGDLD